MPVPGIISTLAPAIGGVLNSLSARSADNRSMNFSREMYDRTKNDNIAFWQMQNDYNSPQSQMQRFQDAGLNPNLIYGQGNSGNAGQVQTPDLQAPQFSSREWGNAVEKGGAGALNAMYDLKIKQATANNLKEQNNVLLEEAALKRSNNEYVQTQNARAKFDLGLESGLSDTSAETRKEYLRQMRNNIDINTRRDAREAVINASNVQEAASRMLNMHEQNLNLKLNRSQVGLEMNRLRENIQLLKQQGVLNNLDINLKKAGINPNDPTWMRIVAQKLQQWADDPNSSWNDSESIFNDSNYFSKKIFDWFR